MEQFKDSVDASMQKLKTVLSKEGMTEFKSAMPSGKGKELSEEIVNTIVHEMEQFLIHIASCKIDQISGRIESKLAKLGTAGFTLSDEQIEKIKDAITESDEFKRLNILYASEQAKNESDAKNKTNESQDGELEQSDESDESDESDDISVTPVDKIVSVLNNINKDKKLKDFKEYLTSLGGSSTSFSVFGEKLKASTLEKILPKVKFFGEYYEKIYQAISIATDSTFTLGRNIEKLTKSFITVGGKLLKASVTAIAATVALAASAAALVLSNIALKTALITTATSNITLAASNIMLAASNIALAMTNIALAVTTLVSLITISFTLIVSMISIFATVMTAVVGIVVSVSLAAASVLISVAAMTVAVVATILALSIAIAAVILVLSAAVVIVTAIVVSAVALMAITMSAAVFLMASALGLTVLFVSGLLAVAILTVAAAMAIVGTAVLTMLGVFILSAATLSFAMSAVALLVAAEIAVLTAAAIVGIVMATAAGFAAITLISTTALAFAGVALTTAVLAVAAALGGIMLGLLLVFLLMYFLIMEGVDALIEWVKNLSIYKWWTEEVEPAGGLWEYIKQKFNGAFSWFEKLRDENGGWLGAIWACLVDWWTGDKDGGGLWDWIWQKMKSTWEWAGDFVGWLWEKIKSGFTAAFGWMSDLSGALKNGMINWWLQSELRSIIKKIADFIGIQMDDPPPADWPKPADIPQTIPPSRPAINDAIKENLLYVKRVKASTDLNWLNEQLSIWSSSDALEKTAGDDTLKKLVDAKVAALKRQIEKVQKKGGGESKIAEQVGEQTNAPMSGIEQSQNETQTEIEHASEDIQNETEKENKKRDEQIQRREDAVAGVEQKIENDNQRQSAEKQTIPYAVPYEQTGLASENM